MIILIYYFVKFIDVMVIELAHFKVTIIVMVIMVLDCSYY